MIKWVIICYIWRCAHLTGRSGERWSFWMMVSQSGVSPTKHPAEPKSSSPVSMFCVFFKYVISLYWTVFHFHIMVNVGSGTVIYRLFFLLHCITSIWQHWHTKIFKKLKTTSKYVLMYVKDWKFGSGPKVNQCIYATFTHHSSHIANSIHIYRIFWFLLIKKTQRQQQWHCW